VSLKGLRADVGRGWVRPEVSRGPSPGHEEGRDRRTGLGAWGKEDPALRINGAFSPPPHRVQTKNQWRSCLPPPQPRFKRYAAFILNTHLVGSKQSPDLPAAATPASRSQPMGGGPAARRRCPRSSRSACGTSSSMTAAAWTPPAAGRIRARGGGALRRHRWGGFGSSAP